MGTIKYTQNAILLAMYEDHSRYKDVVINPSRHPQDQLPEAQLFAHRCVLISVSQLFKERIGRGRCMCSVYTPSVSYKTWGNILQLLYTGTLHVNDAQVVCEMIQAARKMKMDVIVKCLEEFLTCNMKDSKAEMICDHMKCKDGSRDITIDLTDAYDEDSDVEIISVVTEAFAISSDDDFAPQLPLGNRRNSSATVTKETEKETVQIKQEMLDKSAQCPNMLDDNDITVEQKITDDNLPSVTIKQEMPRENSENNNTSQSLNMLDKNELSIGQNINDDNLTVTKTVESSKTVVVIDNNKNSGESSTTSTPKVVTSTEVQTDLQDIQSDEVNNHSSLPVRTCSVKLTNISISNHQTKVQNLLSNRGGPFETEVNPMYSSNKLMLEAYKDQVAKRKRFTDLSDSSDSDDTLPTMTRKRPKSPKASVGSSTGPSETNNQSDATEMLVPLYSCASKKCSKCPFVAKFFTGLFKHAEEQHDGKVKCKSCDEEFKTQGTLRSHNVKFHFHKVARRVSP